MKTLNAKRIAAVVAGAALLGAGLAFAGPITFQNVPIINNAGQPVVQIVIGSTAKPWDGVTAANIAAAIGNLAYTSVPVTATVNQTRANSVLHVAVSSSSYTLSNQQVWLNESGAIGSGGGTYVFSALIGSVLNGAVVLGTPQFTKSLQGTGQYAFPQTKAIASSPNPSPYTTIALPPISTSVTAASNGGGVTFTSFTSSSNDNILQLTSSQFPALLSNWGGNGETGYLWLTGFPVFDQGSAGSSVNLFQLLDAGGAYQVIFNTPIQNSTSNAGTKINVPIKLFGQNYTILSAIGAGKSVTIPSTNTIAGGKVQLASALIPLQTVYVGHNITTGPWTVQLTDLGQATSGGVSPASISILYNNVLTNTSSIFPGNTIRFNVTGKTIYVNVNQTFAGLYAYQKWAKIQLYTNVFNITNGKVYNQSSDPGWFTTLLWTNTTSSSGTANAVALQSIIVYNTTPATLNPGQSFTFIQNPQAFKVTFLGDTLGASSFDTVTLASSFVGTISQYQNLGTGVSPGLTIQNVTEPGQELTVTSQIPNAFSFAGQTASSVVYDLTPFQLNEVGNSVINTGTTNAIPVANDVQLLYNGANAVFAANWVTATNPLLVTVTGFTSNTATTPVSQTLTFTTNSLTGPAGTSNTALSTALFNVTGIQLNRALPGTLTVTVNVISTGANTANTVTLATLKNVGQAGVLYATSSKVYQQALSLTAPGNVIYNQQNGQPTNTFVLSSLSTANAPTAGGITQEFLYNMGEVAVPSNTAATDEVTVGLDNNSAGIVATPGFQLNYSASTSATSAGTKNNATYFPSSQGASFNVQQAFRTEKGSKMVSITPTLVTVNLAKAQDWLQFSVGSFSSNTPTKSFKLFGPYGIGQATNIANVSIGAVNATIKVGTANFIITGINNLTATPSVATATQPVLLRNLTTTPLVVLDSQANSGSNLILIGSGFVNTLSNQLQAAYNISMQPTTQIAQAYGTNRVLIAGYYANQTNAAGNGFIQQLYAQAH